MGKPLRSRISETGPPNQEVTVEFWLKATAAANEITFSAVPDAIGNRFLFHSNYSDGFTYWDFGNIGSRGSRFPRWRDRSVRGRITPW